MWELKELENSTLKKMMIKEKQEENSHNVESDATESTQ